MKIKESLIIVGKGASSEQFLQLQLLSPEQNNFLNAEVWAINSLGTVLRCDKIVAMDSIPLSIKRGEKEWTSDRIEYLKQTQIPILSIEKVEGLNIIEYPLHTVTEAFGGFQYFNSTVAYSLALAITMGVKHLGLFGLDFTWGHTDKNYCEEGRACVEFWLGIAMEKGIRIQIPGTSTLMDSYNGRRLYGYYELEQVRLITGGETE